MLQRVLIFLGYLLGTVIVVGGTILLIAYGNGYSYDFKSGRLVHRGLVIVDSTPGNAEIKLGDKKLTKNTPYRQTFERGEYDFTVSKEGYRTWQKRIEVTPAQVSLAQYIILMPERFKEETIKTFPAISQFVGSRDRRRIAFTVTAGPEAGVWLLDTQNRKTNRIYISPASPAGQPTESVQIESWSNDNSHLLLRTTVAEQASYLVVAADGNDPPINLTNVFRTDFSGLRFHPNNWRELYWTSPEGLRRVNLGDQTLSSVLAERVAGFTFDGDRVLYVDSALPAASVWVLERNGRKKKLVPALPPSSSYSLAYATYINTPQLAVIAKDSGSTTLFSDIYEKPTPIPVPVSGDQAVFNGDGRFVLISADKQVSVYDLERNRIYRFPEGDKPITGISWYDNYHLQFSRGDQIILSEFDHNYAINLTRGNNLPPYNSSNGKNMITTAPDAAGNTQIKLVKIRQ